MKGHSVKRFNYLDEKKAFEYYKAGKTDAEIAEDCGVCRETVKNWRKRNGLTLNRTKGVREKSNLTPLERDAIEARKLGLTYGQYKAGQYLAQQKRKGW